MINPLSGWSWEPCAGGVMLSARDAPEAGEIAYLERVRPLDGCAARVAREVARLEVGVDRVHAPEELVTREGEYAQLIEVAARRAGLPVTILLGQVLVDDFYSSTIACVRDASERPRFAAAVRALVEGDTHMMERRRRRYRHQAPSGWTAATVGSHLNAVWRAPESRPSELVVAAALPWTSGRPLASAALIQAHCRGDGERRAHVVGTPSLVAARGDLDGSSWLLSADDGTWMRHVAVLRDHHFVYSLHVHGLPERAARDRQILDAVVAGVEPLPSSAQLLDPRALFDYVIG